MLGPNGLSSHSFIHSCLTHHHQVIAYALSPLDLIPDFIPVLGLLDDLILLPGLIWLALKLIPKQVIVMKETVVQLASHDGGPLLHQLH